MNLKEFEVMGLQTLLIILEASGSSIVMPRICVYSCTNSREPSSWCVYYAVEIKGPCLFKKTHEWGILVQFQGRKRVTRR